MMPCSSPPQHLAAAVDSSRPSLAASAVPPETPRLLRFNPRPSHAADDVFLILSASLLKAQTGASSHCR
ncbi:hypothetical protein M0R45_006401 [Rubus argutus]|uniref:Uncharacterized protein n=1 Tax=Rubus argutus TaxID=59490 RepID=A0AAW1YQI7_RUBAR